MVSASKLKILTTEPPGSAAFKEAHKGRIGGAGVADILGFGRITPFRRWAIITGKVEPEDISKLPWIVSGNRLEPTVVQFWEEDTGRRAAPSPGTIQHQKLPYLIGTPDRMILEGKENPTGILEVKTTSAFFRSDWDEGVPDLHKVQLHTYFAVTGERWGSFGALCGHDFLWKDQVADETFLDWMLNELEDFWHKYVRTDTPPPISGKEADARTLRQMHPDDNGLSVPLSMESIEATRELPDLEAQANEIAEKIDQRKNLIRADMGPNTYGIGPDFQWSWKTQEKAEYLVPASKTRVLRKSKRK